MRKGKKTEESSKPKIFYSKKPSIVYCPRITMSDGSSSTSLIEPREDRGSSSTALPPSPMTLEDDSGGNQYGNPLNPILNRQIRISDQLESTRNSIALSMTDRMLPEWIMGVLGHANLIYICPDGHIWFTYGQKSKLYCIVNSIVKEGLRDPKGTALEDLLVRAHNVENNREYALDYVSDIVMDQHSNLFILLNTERAYIERYRLVGFFGVLPLINQFLLYDGRGKEEDAIESLELGKLSTPIRTQKYLQALSIGGDHNYLFVVGHGGSDVAIFSYDPRGKRVMTKVKIIEMNQHVPNRHGTIHIFTDHSKTMIYTHFINAGILRQLDSQFNTIRGTYAFVPDEPVIFVKWKFDNLQVFANQDGLPIVYEINLSNGGALARTIRDPWIESLRSNPTLEPIFGFSESPHGIYVYCRDRIVDITLS
jgi:hypothetical protein